MSARLHFDADIVAAIAEAAKTVDGPLIQARYNESRALEANRSAPSALTVVKRFGSWSEALEAAGVEPHRPRYRHAVDDAVVPRGLAGTSAQTSSRR